VDRDLKEIECVVESAKSKGISLKEYVLLKNLYQNRTEERKCDKRGDQKRNFFAHSGLERTLTYVKVNEKDKIELFYSLDRKSEILSWIKNPDD
jgi:CRISPR/Cas system-associated protein Csx1